MGDRPKSGLARDVVVFTIGVVLLLIPIVYEVIYGTGG
jgi:hypothetical protein